MRIDKPLPSSGLPQPKSERLDSWKEIAAYLQRDERTVRRWEAEGLPVRRKLHKKQASVFAFKAEVDAWWNGGRQRLDESQPSRLPKWLVPWAMGGSRRVRWEIPAAGLVLIGLVVVGTLYWTRNSRERWARDQALPEIVRLFV